jgi:branched-chain amino acid transport system substrate-binding protein
MLVLTLVLLVLGLMSALLFSACGSSTDDTATTAATTATTAPAAQETTTTGATTQTTTAAVTFDGEIVIGALSSITGPNAMTGAEQKWAYDKAVADINAKGGISLNGKKMELKLDYMDDQSDSVASVAAAEKLVKVEGCKIILSSCITPHIFAVATGVTEKYQVYYHTVYSWADQHAAKQYKFASSLFFTPLVAGEVPFQVADLQPEAERPQNWATLMEDTPDGQGLGGAIAELAKGHGYNLKMAEAFTPGTKDFASIILKMKESGIDAVLVLCTPTDGITFVKQMKEQNFSPRLVYGWKGFWPNEFAGALGTDANGVGHDGFWSESLPYPYCAELGQQYRDTHDGFDSVAIGLSYASVQILAMAIERAGSADAAAVRDQVYGGTFKGTTMGDVTYGADGVCYIPSLGLWWKDGKRLIYWPDQGNKFEWFVPWDQR